MGWWISKQGRIYANSDHYEFVKSRPRLFGLPKEVSSFGLTERQSILDAVIDKGWIRARGDRRQGLTFEVLSMDPDTLWNIKKFLVEAKWDPDQVVMVDDRRRRPLNEPASFFMSDAALSVAANPGRGRRGKKRSPARRP